MNAPEKSPLTSSQDQRRTSAEAQAFFPVEGLQHLNQASAQRCQSILGHGGTYGVWETPEALIAFMGAGAYRFIDLRSQIARNLPDEIPSSPALEALLDEGVLWLTRLALLMRMGPAGIGLRAKFKPLDASTIAGILANYLPRVVAQGVARRLECAEKSITGFAATLTADELRELWTDTYLRRELKRLTQLQGLNLWTDAPVAFEFKGKTTAVRGARRQRQPERKSVPFQAIPDDYVAAMGPRVLWLIKDLGPNLVHLLDTLPTLLKHGKFYSDSTNLRIARYFEANVWRDRDGQIIVRPPFDLRHGTGSGKHLRRAPSQHDPFEWPPRHWTSVKALAAMLQGAHLWIALLVMAARIGEIATLRRDCIEFARDGKAYANGKTYKPSRALSGREREWPIPEILIDVFAQQVKLVEVSERLAQLFNDQGEMSELIGDSTHLWASLGTSSRAEATEKLAHFGDSLQSLASRMCLTPKPGGKNLHPHRFRKTLARLAGLAIDGSQKVLMLLLGHEDVTTTLGYMQADPSFAKEVDDITRELRILRGEALIEDMREAMRDSHSPLYGGHGGGGAPVLADAVRVYGEQLHRTGEEWGVDTARELAVLLTNNGESARVISAYVVCTKVTGEAGLCTQKKGRIDASNCQTECRNRIEDKTGRRDTERIIPIVVQHAQQNLADNNWLPLQRDKKQLEHELKRYPDIGAKWRDKPEVRAILEAVI